MLNYKLYQHCFAMQMITFKPAFPWWQNTSTNKGIPWSITFSGCDRWWPLKLVMNVHSSGWTSQRSSCSRCSSRCFVCWEHACFIAIWWWHDILLGCSRERGLCLPAMCLAARSLCVIRLKPANQVLCWSCFDNKASISGQERLIVPLPTSIIPASDNDSDSDSQQPLSGWYFFCRVCFNECRFAKWNVLYNVI